MKVEYVTSTLGIGTELHISSAEYKRVNSEAGWSEHPNLMFAVRSYTKEKYSLQGTTQGNGLTGGLPPVRFSM